jgi:hypothetical protein
MWGQSLRRTAALIAFLAFSAVTGFANARAQQSDDLDTLNQQAAQLYGGGKYAEASDIAKRALALAEHQFGPIMQKSQHCQSTRKKTCGGADGRHGSAIHGSVQAWNRDDARGTPSR